MYIEWKDSLDEPRQLLTDKLHELIGDKDVEFGYTRRIVDYVCEVLTPEERNNLLLSIARYAQYQDEHTNKLTVYRSRLHTVSRQDLINTKKQYRKVCY